MFQLCYDAMCDSPTQATKCSFLKSYNEKCVGAGYAGIPPGTVCAVVVEPTKDSEAKTTQSRSTAKPIPSTSKTNSPKPTDVTKSVIESTISPATSTDNGSDPTIQPNTTINDKVNPTSNVEDENKCKTNSTLQAGMRLYCQLTLFGPGANLKCNKVSGGQGKTSRMRRITTLPFGHVAFFKSLFES